MVARRLAGCTVTVHFLGTEYVVQLLPCALKMICVVLLLCRRTRGQFFGLKLKLPLFGVQG